MIISLKSCLPALAKALNEKPDTLYERQRALVRDGLLKALPGRGRGSGVVATVDSVAMLLISLLATMSLSDAGPRTRTIAKAPSTKGQCPLTGASTFRDAVAKVLASETLSGRVREILVGGDAAQAFLRYDGAAGLVSPEAYAANPPKSSLFIGKASRSGGLRTVVSIDGDTIRALTKIVSGLGEEKP